MINGESIAWIGAIPDMLRKDSVIHSDEIRDTFGDLKKRDFNIKSICDGGEPDPATTANARCYLAVSIYTSVALYVFATSNIQNIFMLRNDYHMPYNIYCSYTDA